MGDNLLPLAVCSGASMVFVGLLYVSSALDRINETLKKDRK